MYSNKRKIRDLLLSFPLTREFLFFIYQKKVYKNYVNKKIIALLTNKKKLRTKKIDNLIVSLTSFPQRISEVKYTIYSLLDQTMLPEKIILWLAESQFPNKEQELPDELLKFRDLGLAINWCEDIKSFKKLIPALEQFPNYYIVTADDDLYYKRNWLEKLWLEHLRYPDDVVCHLGEEILFKDKKLLQYDQWIKYIKKEKESFRILVCSGGGGLFHRQYLHKDIVKSGLFLTLTPHADDIWFYFMTILNSTKVRVIKKPFYKVKYVNPYREYGLDNGYTLASINVNGGMNDKQFKNVQKYYGIDIYKLTGKSEYEQ